MLAFTTYRQLIMLLIFSSTVTNVSAQSVPEKIETSARQFASRVSASRGVSGAKIIVQKVDPRLKLADCPAPLQVSESGQSQQKSRMLLRVECQQGTPWAIYVPVTIEYQVPIYRFKRPFQRGEQIAVEDLSLEWVSSNSSHAHYQFHPQTLATLELNRPVTAGSIVTSQAFKSLSLVRRGETVSIIARTAGLEIKMEGEALSNGSQGETIRVKNHSSGKILEGKVSAVGEIMVRM
jgi:flagellar basal body P-ring formation protein FlgA